MINYYAPVIFQDSMGTVAESVTHSWWRSTVHVPRRLSDSDLPDGPLRPASAPHCLLSWSLSMLCDGDDPAITRHGRACVWRNGVYFHLPAGVWNWMAARAMVLSQ